jgi:hypothetical protein
MLASLFHSRNRLNVSVSGNRVWTRLVKAKRVNQVSRCSRGP